MKDRGGTSDDDATPAVDTFAARASATPSDTLVKPARRGS